MDSWMLVSSVKHNINHQTTLKSRLFFFFSFFTIAHKCVTLLTITFIKFRRKWISSESYICRLTEEVRLIHFQQIPNPLKRLIWEMQRDIMIHAFYFRCNFKSATTYLIVLMSALNKVVSKPRKFQWRAAK